MKRISLLLLLFVVVIFSTDAAFSQNISKDTLDVKLLEKLISQKLDSIRAKKKLSKYVYNDTIYKAAKGHAAYMCKTGNFSHSETISKTKTPGLRLEKVGLQKSLYGENIAYVFTDILQEKSTPLMSDYKSIASEIVLLWVNSKPHYQNICNPQFKLDAVAVSYDSSSGKVYAVHNFTSNQ